MSQNPFDILKNSRPSQARIQDDRRRMNQGPAIHDAKTVADAALAQPPVGSLMPYAGPVSTIPADSKWLHCDGRILAIEEYPDLYAVIGAAWNIGIEPTGYFRLPDGRGRSPLGAGQGTNLTARSLGQTLGNESHTLTLAEMPVHAHGTSTSSVTHDHGNTGDNSHNHGYRKVTNVSSLTGVALSGGGTSTVVTDVVRGDAFTVAITHAHDIGDFSHNHAVTVNDNGGGGSHANMHPSFAVNFIIRALY